MKDADPKSVQEQKRKIFETLGYEYLSEGLTQDGLEMVLRMGQSLSHSHPSASFHLLNTVQTLRAFYDKRSKGCTAECAEAMKTLHHDGIAMLICMFVSFVLADEKKDKEEKSAFTPSDN